MPLIVASRRTAPATLVARYGAETAILDLTSRGGEPWVRFSPFYPHGGIPVPFSLGLTAMSVEGIWQGLKVFETADVDPTKFTIVSMRGIKRSARSHGRVLGHRAGIAGERLLPYAEARRAIYLPSYRWVLEHRIPELAQDLLRMSEGRMVVLLDYETNDQIDDLARPLSHACLVKRYIEEHWPE